MVLSSAWAQGNDSQVQANGSSLKDQLLAEENAVATAQRNKDGAAVQRHVAEGFVGVGTNGQPFGRDDMVEGFNEVSLQEYRIYDAEALSLNNAAALLTYDAIVRVSGGDSVVPRYQRVSSVWVNEAGVWKMKFQQATAKKWGD
jgi:hypothetical protein